MILVDNRLTDLVRGYDRISQADLRLQTEWRQNLLRDYASRRERHTSAIGKYLEKAGVLKPQLSIIASIPIVMLIGGLVVAVVGLLLNSYWGTELTWSIIGLSLLFAGAIGLGLPTILWLWQVKFAKPSAPVHPLREDLLSRLTPQWREKLHGALPAPTSQHGDVGEQSFVKHLQALPLDSMYLLYGLQQKQGDDVDVIVLGSRGIWIFEVKYWGGRVGWRDGEWFHERFDPKRRAWVALDEQQPDRQWQRIAAEVSKTFSIRVPDLVRQFPAIERIKGGIVFIHPETIYAVPSICPSRWGVVDSWDQEILSAPIIQGLDDRSIFRLLDALLERHHAINSNVATISMSAYATKIARRAEARLSGWVKD